MTRIVAGTHSGRRIAVPAGRETRPTSDRVREALFSSLASLVDLDGARFADLYAGSGAVGLEALSRGAAEVLFVESDTRAARVIRENLASLALTGQVVVSPVDRVVQDTPPRPFDVVFLDPPYSLASDDLGPVLEGVAAWLADDGVIAVERSSRSEPLRWVENLTLIRHRRYGETTLWYGRRS